MFQKKGTYLDGKGFVDLFPTPKKNGDAWCYFDVRYTSAIGPEDARLPGSRYYRKVCQNGKVIVEPCADRRDEYCNQGKCIKNDWEACLVGDEKGKCPVDNTKAKGCGFGIAPDAVYLKGVDGKVYLFGGDFRNSYQQFPKTMQQGDIGGEFISPLLGDLGLAKCTPWLSPGTSSQCSYANFEKAGVTFKKINNVWAVSVSEAGEKGDAGEFSTLSAETGIDMGGCTQKELGGIGIFDLDGDAWYPNPYPRGPGIVNMDQEKLTQLIANPIQPTQTSGGSSGCETDDSKLRTCTDTNSLGRGCALIQEVYDGKRSSIPVDPKLMSVLNLQCNWVGDCDGEPNYVLKSGANYVSKTGISCHKSGENAVSCSFTYECVPWKAPVGGSDCEKCGDDGLPCTQYKCKSLGNKCVYHQTSGTSGGYCQSSDDKTAPTITVVKYPSQPVEPYAPAEFVIKTSEMAECRFDLTNATKKFEEMKYKFGEDYSTEHRVILYPPGSSKMEDSARNYALIKTDGKYAMYIKCVDAVANENAEPSKINFKVMVIPDKKAPKIISINPVSGSPIEYNTVSKKITIRLDEPAECRWEKNDKAFELMNNSFSCDAEFKPSGWTLGYSCIGNVSGVTINSTEETKFYIRCKDQPWLEGNEDNFYQRNAQQQSTEYILRASEKLVIIGVSPSGKYTIGPTDTPELKVALSGGGFKGKSNCSFRITNSNIFGNGSAIKFSITNNNLNRHNLTGLPEGSYNFLITCIDASDNKVERNVSINLAIDRRAPILSRIYEYGNTLKLKTNENSICYYGLNKKDSCYQSFDNLTMLEGVAKEHVLDWSSGSSYYIRCKDYYGNADRACGAIIKAY